MSNKYWPAIGLVCLVINLLAFVAMVPNDPQPANTPLIFHCLSLSVLAWATVTRGLRNDE